MRDKCVGRLLERRFVFAATVAVAGCGVLALLVDASKGAPAPVGTADVSVTKSDSPDPVTTGGALTYLIQVFNAGPDAATDVTVTDKLPKGVSFVSAASTQGACAATGKHAKTVVCTLGTVAVNVGPAYNQAPASVTIHVLAPRKAGTISNTATVSAAVNDPTPKDNSATATTRVIEAKGKGKPKGPTCGGHRATIVGTPGADVLTGTRRNDVIVARGGSDRIRSLGGRDLICAGKGNDVVKSGARPDTVLAAGGADHLAGGAGGDVLRGGRGPDRLRGGRGSDLLAGGPGRDRCFGGPGRDAFRSC